MAISSRVVRVRAEDLLEDDEPTGPPGSRGVGRRRQLAGVALAAVLLPLLTVVLTGLRDSTTIETQVLLYLLAVLAVAVTGGIAVALPAAVVADLLINYFFVQPLHTLDVAKPEQVLALVVFVVVAAVVSGTVELAGRRARAAEQAAREAETLSALAGSDLDEDATLRDVLDQARATFSMEVVSLLHRRDRASAWDEVERSGWTTPGQGAPLRFDLPIGERLRLVGRGPALFAEDQRVLRAFAAAAETAFEGRRLTAQALQARDLELADRQRTALLAAVGHDLRTPLAAVKAAVGSLRQTDVAWTDEERAELLSTVERSADRLDNIVTNLLDASRLQAGALSVAARPVALDEVVGSALLALGEAQGGVLVDVSDDLPYVMVDAGLLERALANVLDNALRYGGAERAVEIHATAGERSMRLEIVDHGPGVAPEDRDRLFVPFQHSGDHDGGQGVGLGLSVARGFVEAMGGALVADSSDGGGLTMRLRLPLADADAEAQPG